MSALRFPHIDWFVVFMWFTGALCAVLLGLLAYTVWWRLQPHPTFELDAREWSCTDERTRLVPVMVGKVMVMQPRTQCVAYHRR